MWITQNRRGATVVDSNFFGLVSAHSRCPANILIQGYLKRNRPTRLLSDICFEIIII